MAIRNSPSRAELAAKFATFKPTELISSDPDQVFEVPMPLSKQPYKSRFDLASEFMGQPEPQSVSNEFQDVVAGMMKLPPLPEPPPTEPGIFGIPFFGDVWTCLIRLGRWLFQLSKKLAICLLAAMLR